MHIIQEESESDSFPLRLKANADVRFFPLRLYIHLVVFIVALQPTQHAIFSTLIVYMSVFVIFNWKNKEKQKFARLNDKGGADDTAADRWWWW